MPRVCFSQVLHDHILDWFTSHSIFFAHLTRLRKRFHPSVSSSPCSFAQIAHVTGSSSAVVPSGSKLTSHSPIQLSHCTGLLSKTRVSCLTGLRVQKCACASRKSPRCRRPSRCAASLCCATGSLQTPLHQHGI